MKQVKLLIAILAVVFSSASAFAPHAKFVTATYSYVSGSLTNPTSYRPITAPCNLAVHYCGVQVTKDATNPDVPDAAALQALYVASSHFAAPGTYGSNGKVFFKQ